MLQLRLVNEIEMSLISELYTFLDLPDDQNKNGQLQRKTGMS